MIATPARITAAATSVRQEIGSPAIAQPRITATTGLTYAYVAAFAGVVERSRYTYAVKPTNEPNVTRYENPSADGSVTRWISNRASSPVTSAATRKTTPPVS